MRFSQKEVADPGFLEGAKKEVERRVLRGKQRAPPILYGRLQAPGRTKEHLLGKPTVRALLAAVLKAPVLANVLGHHPADQLFGLQKTHAPDTH